MSKNFSQVGCAYTGDLLAGITRLNGSGYGFACDALGRRTKNPPLA